MRQIPYGAVYAATVIIFGGVLVAGGVYALNAAGRAPAEDVQAAYTRFLDAPGAHGATIPSVPSVTSGNGAVTDEPAPAPPLRVAIPAIAVDAPVVTLGIDPQGRMEAPSGPADVAWYDFSASPGGPGNAVLSGHLDWAGFGPAVFWDLRCLRVGDEVRVSLADGSEVTYVVSTIESYPVDDIPMVDILADGLVPMLTIITCDGAFAGSQYTDRLVVQAVRR